MERQELIPHLFRTEFRKIVSVLCSAFGIAHMETAEDLAGETFLAALETWPYQGVPPNPVAWLYTVARNKAKNLVARDKLFMEKIAARLRRDQTGGYEPEIDLSEQNITDSQLRMLFAVCHPALAVEGRIGLALQVLCGFGIEEIADALLSNKETINKRLHRAKEKLKEEGVSVTLPPPHALNDRLGDVLAILYLLFNEGYYSERNDRVLREELCMEAMRLTYLLTANEVTNQPPVSALLSLMCFHASRFDAREDEDGSMILYQDQDEALWNKELITRGVYFLNLSSRGDTLSKYHLEASIAYWHTIKEDTPEKWEQILQLYNRLLRLEYSPIAALNRTYALAKANGKEEAIREAEKLQQNNNPYYFTLLGELYADTDKATAIRHLETAYGLARSSADKEVIKRRIASLS